MKILVLSGGDSPERPVSLRSGAAVAKALASAGLEFSQADPVNGLLELDELYENDIVFPILHGAGGEDGTIQLQLEDRNLRYLGTASAESRVCFDKHLTRLALQNAGLPVADGELVTADTYFDSSFRSKPHVIKAVGGGSSIGTLIVRDTAGFDPARLSEVFAVSDNAVIEELIEGIEITVPILGLDALPVIEIRPPDSGEFDYENKYNGKTRELCPPVSISPRLQRKAQKLAEKAHALLGARDLSRVDMIVQPDGHIPILEINTMPGMTDQSLYPKAAAISGLAFPDLMKKFVALINARS